MARRFKLRELERKHGDLHKVIPPLVNTQNQQGAAQVLETTQATISNWLTANHYQPTTTWLPKEQAVERQLAFLRALKAQAEWLVSDRLNEEIAALEALLEERAV